MSCESFVRVSALLGRFPADWLCDVTVPLRTMWPTIGRVFEVHREEQDILVAIGRHAQEISVQEMRAALSSGRMNHGRPSRPPPGPPPTIGYLRAQCVTRFRVSCTSNNCMHGSDMTFDALGMPDDVLFPSIATGAAGSARTAGRGRSMSCRGGRRGSRLHGFKLYWLPA